jgi:hypothetical protein
LPPSESGLKALSIEQLAWCHADGAVPDWVSERTIRAYDGRGPGGLDAFTQPECANYFAARDEPNLAESALEDTCTVSYRWKPETRSGG